MPVFNTAPFVADACRSIFDQSFSDLELIVIDDGSTDASCSILENLARIDSRMVLIRRENRGLIATRNELVARASAPLIAWMDSDDVSRPDRLQRQIECFAAEPDLVCVGGNVQAVDPDGEPIGMECYPEHHEDILKDMLQGGAMRFPSTMMLTEAVRSAGGFRSPFLMGEDLDLFLRLSEMGRIKNLQHTILDYRQHLTNTSRLLSDRWPVYRDAIIALANERKVGKDLLQRGIPLQLEFPAKSPADLIEWRSQLDWANRAVTFGHFSTARKYLLRCLLERPFDRGPWKVMWRYAVAAVLRNLFLVERRDRSRLN